MDDVKVSPAMAQRQGQVIGARARRLTWAAGQRERQVAVPGEAVGPSGYLRLSYALGDDALLEGVQRLQRLFG